MSSDEEFQDLPSDYDDDYQDDDFLIDDDPPVPVARAPQPPAPVQYYQPPPAPLGGLFADIAAPETRLGGGSGRFNHPGAFQAGFGGHAFARPPANAFRRQYRAYSTAILEVQEGRSYGGGRSNLMYGGKTLDEITQLDIELPIDFEITNPAIPDLNTHVGVLEFIAQEGTVNLPQWVMDQLRLNEGDPIRIWGGRYPKGEMIKMQPQSVDFLEVSNPKAVLEQAMRNFSCLSAGDIIEIVYETLTFRVLIMEIHPPGPAISVIDTNLEVDFAPPVGYVEPERKPLAAAPTMKDKYVIDTASKQDVDARGSGSSTPVPGGASTPSSWEAFKGSGNSLNGKRIKGKGVKAKQIVPVTEGSRIIRTDQPRIITADTQIGGRQVPAALNVPFGNLFFGYDYRPPPGSEEELAAKAAREQEASAAVAPFASVGQGNTLSGRARAAAAAPRGASPAGSSTGTSSNSRRPAAESKPAVPFSGSGNTLSGRKKIEQIEID